MCREARTIVRAHRIAMAVIARFACLEILQQQQHQVAIMFIDSSFYIICACVNLKLFKYVL